MSTSDCISHIPATLGEVLSSRDVWCCFKLFARNNLNVKLWVSWGHCTCWDKLECQETWSEAGFEGWAKSNPSHQTPGEWKEPEESSSQLFHTPIHKEQSHYPRSLHISLKQLSIFTQQASTECFLCSTPIKQGRGSIVQETVCFFI